MQRKVLILGGTGMLGHTLFRELSQREDMDVYATARIGNNLSRWFSAELLKKVHVDVDADNFDTVIRSFASVQPSLVINCIGLIKQQSIASDPLSAITINSQLPHRIALVCRTAGARLIHISTDCVFDGRKGQYTEADPSNAVDLYGRSKFLGEVDYPPHCITLRTSIIGHELKGKLGLIEWFLSQAGRVRGFTRAIYSGFPTLEFARIIAEYVIPNDHLTGIYHVSSDPISKYDLLRLVAERYGKQIDIEPHDDFFMERSLDSTVFRRLTGYNPPSWSKLIDLMYQHYLSSYDDKEQLTR
ncbi:MAG: SDR family oxidoreductase [Deltaproteobacteria bacterium]|nr:SDR family oxidoreductase [Deltaproteobacteria bacterium]